MSSGDAMEMRKFVAPEIVYGLGAIHLAGQYARNLGASKVLLVSDPGVQAAGWTALARASLVQEGLAVELFTDVSPNPREAEVMRGAVVYTGADCNAIVAVGGGSPMDCAKGIGIVTAAGGHILDYEGVDQVHEPIPPLVCIPTTAGSAAEVSQFSIISDQARRVKIAIVSKVVVPDVALLDPQTTTTMDPYLTACTGLDALTHAIEAYTSTAYGPLTDLYALEAIRLVVRNLTAAIHAPQDLEPRSNMLLGSMYAGLAFSNAILGAVHAMAHSLGGFLDLPHGECNAILLEHVVAYNFSAIPERYRAVTAALGQEVDDLDHATLLQVLLETLRGLKRSAGVTRTLSQLGVRPGDFRQLAINACEDACLVTNPRSATVDDIERIYEAAF